MLRGIAVFSMRGRWQSALAVALLSVVAFLLPPVSYLGSGVIALSTLRVGPKEGLKVLVATTVVFTLFAALLLHTPLASVAFLLSSWLPVWGATLVLGYTRSLATSLIASAAMGIFIVLLTHLLLSDPAVWWQEQLSPFMTLFTEQPGWQLDAEQTNDVLLTISGLMTGLVAAGFVFNVIAGLLLGRAWQAQLYNPGGFATEFRALSLGKPAALVAIACIVLALGLGETVALLADFLPVMLVIFAVQGLSVVHAIVMQKQRHKFWLVAVYVLLIIMMPQMVAVLAMIGILEQWFNFRLRSN